MVVSGYQDLDPVGSAQVVLLCMHAVLVSSFALRLRLSD